MKNIDKLRELVLEKVDLTDLMLSYGVQFAFNPLKALEVQYHCPFHGQDKKPSARLYKATQSCWCWVCHKKWDVIRFVMDKENLNYIGALLFLVRKYQLDISSIPDTPVFELKKPKTISKSKVLLMDLKNRIKEQRGIIPYDKYSALVTAWYIIDFNLSKEKDISESITKLKDKLDTICKK